MLEHLMTVHYVKGVVVERQPVNIAGDERYIFSTFIAGMLPRLIQYTRRNGRLDASDLLNALGQVNRDGPRSTSNVQQSVRRFQMREQVGTRVACVACAMASKHGLVVT